MMHIFRNIVIRKQDNPYEERNKTDDRYYRAFAEISNGELDTDGHIMGDDTLRNFARQAKSGVQVKDSHEWKNGFGRTFDAKYEKSESRVVSGLRITRDMPLGDSKSYPNSDAFVTAIEDEIITQVSIGAYGGDLVCNICNASMYSSRDCYHWPLITYLVTDDDGVKEKVVCTATYVGGKLREVSLVDKGACPGAEILKVRLDDQLEKGIISDSHLYLVKSMYGLPEGMGFSYPSGDLGVGGSGLSDSGTDDLDKLVDDSVDDLDSVDSINGSGDSNNSGDEKMNLDEAKQEIARLEKRYEELEKEDKKKTLQIDELKHIESELKDEKGQLRKELIDLWKDEVRENFNGDELTRYEKRLEKMDIWNLKEEKSLLESIVKSKSSGGSLDSGDGESDSDSSDGGGDDEGSQLKSQSGGGKDVKSLRKTKDNPKKAVHDLDKSLDDDDIPRPPSPESSSLHRMFPGIG